MKSEAIISGIILGMSKETEIPKELQKFLKKDDQGIEGLLFMIKNHKLSKRIPSDVRTQYEETRAEFINTLEGSLKEILENVEKLMKDDKAKEEFAHTMIQEICDYEDSK